MAIPEAASMTTPGVVMESESPEGQNNELPDVATANEGDQSNGNANNSLNESQLQQQKEHLEKLQELHRQILIEQQKLQEMQGGGLGGGLDFNVSGDASGRVSRGEAPNDLDGDEVSDFAQTLAQQVSSSSPSSIKDVVLPTVGQDNSSGASSLHNKGMLPPPTLSSSAVFPQEKAEDSRQKRKNSWRKKWHSDRDLPHRRDVIRRIAELLLQRKRNPEEKWKAQLPYKARRLEEQLYKTASSFEEYINEKTLRARLKVVATAITSKFRETKRKHRSISDGASMRERFAKSKMSSSSQGSFSSLLGSLDGDSSGAMGQGKLGARSMGGSLGSMDLVNAMGGQTSQSLQDQLLLNLKAQQQQRIAGMANGGTMNFNAVGDGTGAEASALSQQQLSSPLSQTNQFMAGVAQSPQVGRNSLGGGSLADLIAMNQTQANGHRNSLVNMLSPGTIQQLSHLDGLGQTTPEQQQQQNQMMRQLMQRQGSMGSVAGGDQLGIPPPPVVPGQGIPQLDHQQQQLLLLQQRFGGLGGMNNLAMGGAVGPQGAGAGQNNTSGNSGGVTPKTDSFDQADFSGVSALGITPESFGW